MTTGTGEGLGTGPTSIAIACPRASRTDTVATPERTHVGALASGSLMTTPPWREPPAPLQPVNRRSRASAEQVGRPAVGRSDGCGDGAGVASIQATTPGASVEPAGAVGSSAATDRAETAQGESAQPPPGTPDAPRA